MQIIKYIICFAIIIVSNSCLAQIKDKNSKAREETEKELNIICDYVYKNDTDSTLKRVGAIHFLEQLSGVKSQALHGNFGVLDASEEDYQAWLRWYDLNKAKLYWNEKTKSVEVFE